MISRAVNSSYFIFDCFDCAKVLAGTTRKSCSGREVLYRDLAVNRENAVGLKQCHSDRIALVHEGLLEEIPETDALITDAKGVLLTIRTADCVPVFVFDSENQVIALIHAGWKGAQLGIVKKTVAELVLKKGTRVQNLQVAFGPSIRACCYEFDPNHVAEFRPFVKPVNGKYHFNLLDYLIQELTGLGISKSSIFDSGICTFCNPEDFFSYRRDRDNPGRMISFLMLK